jgi:hypothetical protein
MADLGHGGSSAWCHVCRFVRHHFGDCSLAASAKAPMRSRTNAHRTTYQCELLLQIEANGPALLLKDDAPAAYLLILYFWWNLA